MVQTLASDVLCMSTSFIPIGFWQTVSPPEEPDVYDSFVYTLVRRRVLTVLISIELGQYRSSDVGF